MKTQKQTVYIASNIALGAHAGSLTRALEASVTTRYLLGAPGTSAATQVAVNAENTRPLGVMTDTGAAGDYISINLLGSASSTQNMVAAGAIAIGAPVFTAAGGKVQAEPTTAGTYYRVGTAISAAAADGDTLEVDPCEAERTVVLAAIGNANGEIAGLSFSSTPTQAEAEALRDKCEELADDVRALTGAMANAASVKVLGA